jgi:RNA polymerase primary sigma factor
MVVIIMARTASFPRSSRDKDSLDIYLRDIRKYPLISREEEGELARRAQDGDQAALDTLVRSNLRFVVSVAKKYSGQGVPLEDLINDGNLGLVRAAHRFDPDRGYKFISYAVWWVRQAILHSLSHSSRVVRLPLNKAGYISKISKASQVLVQDLGREPSNAEIAEKVGITEREVEETLRVAGGHLSLDSTYSNENDDQSFVESVEDIEGNAPDDDMYQQFLSRDVIRAIDTLNERERTIMMMYFGLGGHSPRTLEEIGGELGLTRERIRQIKEQAIEKLRQSSRSGYLSPYVGN